MTLTTDQWSQHKAGRKPDALLQAWAPWSSVNMSSAASKLMELILVLAATVISLSCEEHLVIMQRGKIHWREAELEDKTRKTVNGVQYFTCWRRKKRLCWKNKEGFSLRTCDKDRTVTVKGTLWHFSNCPSFVAPRVRGEAAYQHPMNLSY